MDIEKRLAIKEDLKEICAEKRTVLGGYYPRYCITDKQIKTMEPLKINLYVGDNMTECKTNVLKLRNSKRFIHLVSKYGLGLEMQQYAEKNTDPVRIRIVLTLPPEI